jgi:hypothetical protein
VPASVLHEVSRVYAGLKVQADAQTRRLGKTGRESAEAGAMPLVNCHWGE